MITPEDLVLTEKMRAEVRTISPYSSLTSWNQRDGRITAQCVRCDWCEGVLAIHTTTVTEERIAQHLVTDHGYTYDGLTPYEMQEACRD